MREIKFRAWDKEEKYMKDWKNLMAHGYGGNKITDPEIDDSIFNDPDYILVQYTGLKDKNGKETYEGDIIKVLDRDWPSQLDNFPHLNHEQYIDHIATTAEVVYDRDRFILREIKGMGYYLPHLRMWSGRDYFEVIGNVYDNPELMEAI